MAAQWGFDDPSRTTSSETEIERPSILQMTAIGMEVEKLMRCTRGRWFVTF
jgi:hypothetical protein